MNRTFKLNVVFGVTLVFLGLAIFGKVFDYPFLGGDDKLNVFRNGFVLSPSFEKILEIWQRPLVALYIPFTYTIWSAIAWIAPATGTFGISAGPFHAANLLFHILNSLLVFFLIQKLFLAHSKFKKDTQKIKISAFLGAFLFLAHPLQIESVAWVTGMKELLFSFFGFSSVLFYINHLKTSRKKDQFYILSFLFFLFSVLSKPTGIVVLLVNLLISTVWLKRSIKTTLKELLPWIITAIAVVVLTKSIQHGVGLILVPPIWLRPLVALDAISFYLVKMLLPIHLSFDYARTPEFIANNGWIYFSWIPATLLLLALWKQRNNRPWLFLSGLLFLVSLLPILGLIPFKYQDTSTVADRYVYFSLFGVAFGFACILKQVKNNNVFYGAGLLCLLLSVMSFVHLNAWSSDESLDRAIHSATPDSPRAQLYLAQQKLKKGEVNTALNYYRKHSNISNRAYPYARVLRKLNRPSEAKKVYQSFLKRFPNHPNKASMLLGLGDIAFKEGKVSKALKYYIQADEEKADFLPAIMGCFVAYKKLGNEKKAEFYQERANKLARALHHQDLPDIRHLYRKGL